MKHIHVVVREKDKGDKNLTLLNLRDEVVNFLYRDTIANSTKSDQQFFVLIYFASLKVGDVSFLENLLDVALPKFHRLSVALSQKGSYLASREYRQRVEEYKLADIFANDMFFILSESILNLDSIESRYGDLYEDSVELTRVMQSLKEKYQPQIRDDYKLFESSRIRDDRYDDNGVVHDLSKSVYRTIRMRNARNLELNLQRYTKVKSVTSNSPIVLDIIQNIEPQIIFDLWNKYHVVEYVSNTLKFLDSNIVAGTISGILSPVLLTKYNEWKAINGAKDPKRKKAAKKAFETAKSQHGDELAKLNARLVESVLDANEHLMREIKLLQADLKEAQEKASAVQDKDLIKKLKARIAELENIEIETTEVIENEQAWKDTGPL